MTLHRIPVALALLSIAIAPLSLAAQGDTTKAAKKTTTTSTAKKSTKAASTTAASSAAAKPTTPAATAAPAAKSQTAAATEQAKCKDGSMYSGTSRKGACSSHGGVAEWVTAVQEHCSEGRDSPLQRRNLLYEGGAPGRVFSPQGRRGVADKGNVTP